MALLRAVDGEVSDENRCLKWPTLADWMEEVQEAPIWLCEGLVPETGLTYVTGHSKRCKKTFFSDLLTLCVASGKAHDLIKPLKSGLVISVQEEGQAQANKGRFNCFIKEYGFDPNCLSNIIYSFRSGVNLLDAQWQEDMINLVTERKPVMMIWDPLTFLHTANENRAEEMKPVIAFARTIAQLGCAVVINAHLNGSRGEDAMADIDSQMRGSTVFINSYDSHIAFRKYRQTLQDEPIEMTVRSKIYPQQDLYAYWDIVDSGKNDGTLLQAKFWTVEREDEESLDSVDPDIADRVPELEYDQGYSVKDLKDLWGISMDVAKRAIDTLTNHGILEKRSRKYYRA